MQVAKIIGHVTATVKHPSLNGWKMSIAQPLRKDDGPDGDPLIVIDQLGSGIGDRVILSSDGVAVRQMMNANDTPVRWAVMGVVDP